MTTLREAAQQALEALEAMNPYPASREDQRAGALAALRAALAQQAEPVEPVAWVLALPDGRLDRLSVVAYDDEAEEMLQRSIAGCTLVPLYTAPPQRPAEPVPEPYTDDVTRLMRDAGMTFHFGLPHKAVVEQMTRVVDLVYAEASIKAAQQFATPPQRLPLTAGEIEHIGMTHQSLRQVVRAVERAVWEKNNG